MIDMDEVGPCSMPHCGREGLRAHGAPDIEDVAARTGVVRKSFYCEGCMAAARARSYIGAITVSSRKRQINKQQIVLGEYN